MHSNGPRVGEVGLKSFISRLQRAPKEYRGCLVITNHKSNAGIIVNDDDCEERGKYISDSIGTKNFTTMVKNKLEWTSTILVDGGNCDGRKLLTMADASSIGRELTFKRL